MNEKTTSIILREPLRAESRGSTAVNELLSARDGGVTRSHRAAISESRDPARAKSR